MDNEISRFAGWLPADLDEMYSLQVMTPSRPIRLIRSLFVLPQPIHRVKRRGEKYSIIRENSNYYFPINSGDL